MNLTIPLELRLRGARPKHRSCVPRGLRSLSPRRDDCWSRPVIPVLVFLAFLPLACSSNRFQIANATGPQIDSLPPPPTTGGGNQLLPPVVVAPVDPVAVPVPQVPEFAATPATGTSAGALPGSYTGQNSHNPNPVGAANRVRITQTPRPGQPGTTLALEPQTRELIGRVVNSQGRPESGASVQVLQVDRPSQVIAEVATNANGAFRIRNLQPGTRYELFASARLGGQRLTGSTTALAPNTGVVIQLNREGAAAISPLRSRLGSPAPSNRSAVPVAGSSSGAVGNVMVSTPAMLGAPLAVSAAPAAAQPVITPSTSQPVAAVTTPPPALPPAVAQPMPPQATSPLPALQPSGVPTSPSLPLGYQPTAVPQPAFQPAAPINPQSAGESRWTPVVPR